MQLICFTPNLTSLLKPGDGEIPLSTYDFNLEIFHFETDLEIRPGPVITEWVGRQTFQPDAFIEIKVDSL